jgi:hypothetical protein
MDVRQRQTGTQIETLLQGKKGTIHYQVSGFKIPFRVTSIEFFRLKPCSTEAGKWVRVYRIREKDLVHHSGALKIVRKWFKEMEGFTAIK